MPGDEELRKRAKYLTSLTLNYMARHPKDLVETIVQLCEFTDPEDAIRRFIALVEEFHYRRLKYEEGEA